MNQILVYKLQFVIFINYHLKIKQKACKSKNSILTIHCLLARMYHTKLFSTLLNLEAISRGTIFNRTPRFRIYKNLLPTILNLYNLYYRYIDQWVFQKPASSCY